MSGAGSTDGIRTLLAAEKRAAEVVKQARNSAFVFVFSRTL